jgi:integrase
MHLQPENDANSWLLSYDRYLRDVVGAAATTRIRYWRVVRRFVAACFNNMAGWTPPSVQQVTDFVCEEAASKKGCGRRVSVTAARSFIRFLAWRGIVPSGLDRAIPRTRLAAHASLPRRLTIDEISRLLDAAMTGKAPCRDRAILLLAVQLGLRSSEIIAMELDDIDWRAGVVRVRIRKSRRERTLPLPRDVGTALADYIQLERPPGCRGLFIGVNNPPSRLSDPTAITQMVKRSLRRAEIPLGRLSGAHMLRHTAASRLINSGASFSEVADLLGHQRLKTTAIYAKLDLATLSRVSMPWIGGAQ